MVTSMLGSTRIHRTRPPRSVRSLVAIGLWLGAVAALAGEGVVEINMASAAAGGVSATDQPGLPVTIDAPGSYRLTGNLTSSDPNQDIIVITTSDVTLDLGGFEISGPADCSTFPCTNIGGGRSVVAFGFDNVTVQNGRIRGMGGFGMELVGAAERVDRVTSSFNGGNGMQIYGSGQVAHCIAEANGDNGIFLLEGSVTDSVVSRNRNSGIYLGGAGLIARNSVLSNGVFGNDAGRSGIRTFGAAALIANTIAGNTTGFSVTSQTGTSQNVLSGNSTPQATGGVPMGGNVCDGTSC